jgi:hypothetical protein
MPKYDFTSLSDAAQAIDSATWDTRETYTPAGGSQYGSWDASVGLPEHEKMSLFHDVPDDLDPSGMRSQTIDDFKPESYEVFLTENFFETFGRFYRSACLAVEVTAKQAAYGAGGLSRMAENMKATEDANLTATFRVLDKMQNRD